MTVVPFNHPARPKGEFRPLKALRHFRKLITDLKLVDPAK